MTEKAREAFEKRVNYRHIEIVLSCMNCQNLRQRKSPIDMWVCKREPKEIQSVLPLHICDLHLC